MSSTKLKLFLTYGFSAINIFALITLLSHFVLFILSENVRILRYKYVQLI